MAKHLRILFIVVCVSCFAILTMWIDRGVGSEINSEKSENDAFAKVAVKGERMEWHINVPFEKLTVTVLGPEESKYVQVFGGESLPFFQRRDNDGKLFPDGVCNYQLLMTPISNKKSSTNRLPAGRDSNEKPTIEQASQKLVTQSGFFVIEEGQIISNEAAVEMETAFQEESSLEARNPDYVINDDVIITGSECIGFDCADGESFGFDTLILKEHNLRIYFNDTSYTASYSRNDWRITINDSTNGGASYFSIDDVTGGSVPFKVEAGAPTNSLYVEDYGRIGLGTSTPVVELHIKDSDTPTMRLEQDTSGGWTAQTWDVAGNESNFFVRDATNGSKLPFRIQPSTPSSTLCLKSDGNVGIGTWSPEAKLHIQSDVDATGPLFLVEREVSGTQTTFFTVKDGGDVELFKTLGQGSDRNQKKNIEPVNTATILKQISELPLSKWSYKSDDDSIVHIGPMAQDFHAAFRLGKDDKHITPIDSSGVALAAIQELYKLVAKQNEMIRELQEKNARLEARLKDS